jgi:lipopolysaccharide/colanic/teichoic acid biosynthesis glycosyltransferase
VATTVAHDTGATPIAARARLRASEVAKRGVDVGIALLLLVLLSPLLLGAMGLVLVSSGRPVFFHQVRIGRHRQPFRIYKFRTMYSGNDDSAHRDQNRRQLAGELNADNGIFKDRADKRVTPLGRWYRRFSLDELPQLVNVIRGDMSLVGPRPSMPWEVELYDERFQVRHAVRPGITGLWQVSGRNRLSMLEMLELDVRYVGARSLRSDVRILLKTPAAIMRGDGAA